MPDINLNPYTAESEAIAKRLRMAEMLAQQSMQPMALPQQAGVRASNLSGLAKMLDAYTAGKETRAAKEEQKALEANTLADFAKLYGVMGQTETVPGRVTTPAVPSAPIPENVARQAELARLNQPEAGFEAQAAIGRNLMQPQDMQQIQNLPTSTAAVPEVREPDRQVSMLRAEALSDPKFMKTNAGRMMLAQALMQQRTQEQAEATRKREAALATQSVGPGAALVQGGKVIFTNPKEPEFTKVETRDPVTGLPIVKYVNKTELGRLGNVAAPYTGIVADIAQAQNLPPQIMNNPQLLNLVGSQLNKTAGQVTEEDVANYMIKVAETRAKLGYEGIPFNAPAGLTAAPNPLVKPAQKITTKAEIADAAKRSGKTIEQVTQDAIAKGYKVQ